MKERLKVLWFVNAPSGPLKKYLNLNLVGTGFWIDALLKRLSELETLTLIVAVVWPYRKNISVTIDKVHYYLISQKRSRIFFNDEKRYLGCCLNLVEKIKPDIIHVHGTERFYGLLGTIIKDIPIIISMQGLIEPCSNWFNYYGRIKFRDILKLETIRNIINGSSPLIGLLRLKKQVKTEYEIIRINKFFEGRTEWDKAYLMSHKKNFVYFHIPRIIRDEFYEKRWDIGKIQKYRIFVNNCRGTRSGADLVIKAFDIVRKHYPQAELYLSGDNPNKTNKYSVYLQHLANKHKDAIYFLGYLNASEIVNQLVKAHVFVHPTYIDNSPNSLAEAQIVGVPVVASCTGGKMTLVEHGKTGLLFPNGDQYLLAERIMQLFESRVLCEKISKNAFLCAMERHNPSRIEEKVINMYYSVLAYNQK